ncbi:hypothetical protein GGH94_003576 [Coemansia aciculifera]|uniref:Chitin-binding type-4 domain-containing protein n=1 Tax=Coemansia aciculifera TaxID=417176 RepID=A0A9W8IQW1_9FUNG|nr:hypothetical protein GGH94_003576 [Coemansia aciculifera]
MLDMQLHMFTLIAVLATIPVFGHMEMTSPCPRYSPKCATPSALPPGAVLDYNLNGPIGGNGNINQPFCKYTKPWPQVSDTWTTGHPVTISFANNGASHSGGHTEFSISYDNANTFVVVHQVLRHMFFTAPPPSGGSDTVRSYTFTLPMGLPGTSHAIFAWTWVNAIGNREFYMNCADVAIIGNAGSYTGKAMTVANYGPMYPTIPEFMGNYNTGIQLYSTNISQVTVTGSGYSNSSTSTTETTSSSTNTPLYTAVSVPPSSGWF